MSSKVGTNVLSVAAAAALVAGFWWQGERFIAANGPTFDEAVHLAAGVSYWATNDFRMNREDPPLMKLWWAVPAAVTGWPAYPHEAAAEVNGDQWQVGTALVYGVGGPPSAVLAPARRMNLAVGCGVVLLAGWWAFRAWGSRLAGVAACAFAALDPNLLALSCVLSTDAGLAFFALLSCYLLWEYAAAPSRWLMTAAGVSLGLMLGAKLSALAVVAGLGAAGTVFLLCGGALALPGAAPAEGRVRGAVDLAFRLGVIALVTLAATYGFVHFDEWGRGLKYQLTRSDHLYLCGETARTGWYHYFLVALAVKLPLGLLAGSALGLLWLVFGGTGIPACAADPTQTGMPVPPKPRHSAVWLVLPPLVFLAAASQSRVDLGLRVVLPVLPFLYVVAGRLAAPGCCLVPRQMALAACLTWSGVSGWLAAPFQIAYANELAGGSVGALRYVADSNVDWGQGLPLLKAYADREGLDAVYLSYFGTDRPAAYGLRFQPLPGYGHIGPMVGEVIPADAPRHVVAVSANNLLGIYLDDPETFAWLWGRPPTAVLGGSIYVYDLTGDPDAVARVRAVAVK